MSKSTEFWTEHLFEKHECGPYEESQARRFDLDAQGVRVTLLAPDWLPPVQPVVTTASGDLLFVLGRMSTPDYKPTNGQGVLLVARRREDGTYGVHVWHELYEWALGYLVGAKGQ